MGPAIYGTLVITGLAAVMAVPLGVLGAIYINEYGGRGPLAQVVRFMADVMTGVPSIVMGLFIFSIWVLHFGYSGLAGAFALACLMLPVVIRSSEEMLKLVPDPLREASYALGATKSRVTLTVVLPAAIGGIVSGALLAIARAAGETAPLLFTILTVTADQPERVQRRQHRALHADLRQRHPALPRRAVPRLGRGVDADRDRLHPHDCRPHRHRAIYPVLALGMPPTRAALGTDMDSPEQNVVASAQLPKPAALQDTPQRDAASPRRRAPRSSTPRASRSTTAPSGPSRTCR